MTRDPFEQRVPGSRLPPELALSGYLPQSPDHRRAPAMTPAAAQLPALEAALDRLEEVIDHENSTLGTRGAHLDFADVNRRKSQSLLELTRLGRALPPGANAALRDGIGRLRGKLLDNQRSLGVHLAAVREIADIMIGALNEAESDGTYGKARPRRDPTR